MNRMTYIESERRCEASFFNAGKWYHLYTSGRGTPCLLKDDEDFIFCMNLMARCCTEHTEITIVAFTIMDNHVHIVTAGEMSGIKLFFNTFRRRLSKYLDARYSSGLPESFSMSLKEIQDLKALRNTIAYVHRNGFVVNSAHTPFTYPWSTGFCFFNIQPQSQPLDSLTVASQRRLMKGRIPPALSRASITPNGCIVPSSCCAVRFGEAMFRDAHHYYSMVSKNVESYSEIAAELDDGEFLTDQELFAELMKILRNSYSCSSIKELSPARKLELARTMHYQYKSSNGQIRRLLGLSQYDVDIMFPSADRR